MVKKQRKCQSTLSTTVFLLSGACRLFPLGNDKGSRNDICNALADLSVHAQRHYNIQLVGVLGKEEGRRGTQPEEA
jgi:hypothetical protein